MDAYTVVLLHGTDVALKKEKREPIKFEKALIYDSH